MTFDWFNCHLCLKVKRFASQPITPLSQVTHLPVVQTHSHVPISRQWFSVCIQGWYWCSCHVILRCRSIASHHRLLTIPQPLFFSLSLSLPFFCFYLSFHHSCVLKLASLVSFFLFFWTSHKSVNLLIWDRCVRLELHV